MAALPFRADSNDSLLTIKPTQEEGGVSAYIETV
jgi:hypothetical protein